MLQKEVYIPTLQTDKLPPLVIEKGRNPNCFKTVRKLFTRYEANTGNSYYLLVLDSKMVSQTRMTLLFMVQDAVHPPATRLHKNVEVVFVHQNCTSILQPLDHGIIRLFKHYYHKLLARRTTVVIDHKLFHDNNNHEGKCFRCTTFYCGIMALCQTCDNTDLYSEMWF